METLIKGASSSTAAAPRWVMLNRYVVKDSGSSTADAETMAAACTSSGLPFSVSFSIAAPPDATSFHYDLLGGEGRRPSSDDDKEKDNDKDLELQIVAAHDDSVLIEARVPQPQRDYFCRGTVLFEYFMYVAGAGRMPWLSLLPGCYVSNLFERDKEAIQFSTRRDKARNLSCFENTGILHRRDGEVLVAELEVGYEAPYSTAELCLLHAGAQDWVLERVPIVHHEGEGVLVRDWTEVDATVSISSRFMCWVDYLSGFLLCDMAEENHKLWPCCGGPGKTSCECSSFAFNVTTWTLDLKTEEPMVWVKDGVLDCDELWQLPNYGRLPHVAPRYPIVSSDDPDIICFTICENHYFIDDADKTVWMFVINMRSKALLSVIRSDTESYAASNFLPAKLHW